jgi:hypothetical protein
MSARYTMTALLLCSCAIIFAPSLTTVTASVAGDLNSVSNANTLVPAAGVSALVVMPAQQATVGSTLNPGASPVLPKTASTQPGAMPAQGVEPSYRDVAPGDNPFAPLVQKATVVATPAPVSAPAATPAANPFAAATDINAAASGKPKTATPEKVDETALRYYAKTRDLKRLGAELRRLKALYPSWEASEDLFNQTTAIDEQPLWDIYATGDLTRLRAEIARIASGNPEWKPSADLMEKVQMAESRKLIDRAYAHANWAQVIVTAQQQPQLLVCGEMNSLWQVGEALAKTKDMARAFDLYKYVFTSCDQPTDRLATMQKASALLPSAGITSLMALGRTLPDGTSEFASFTYDAIRKQMGAMSEGDQMARPLSGADLQSFAAYVETSQSAADASLFGWYYYSQKQWQPAQAWFTAGTQYGDDLKNVEGVILSLRNLGKMDEAYALASRFANKSDNIRKEYIEIVAGALTDEHATLKISDYDLTVFKTHVYGAKSALGAQALGWRLFTDKGPAEARPLFAQSVNWEATEGGVVGLAVVASRSKNKVELAALKQQYGVQFEALKDFNTTAAPKKGRRVVQPITVSAKPAPSKFNRIPSTKWMYSREYAR